MAEQNSTRKWMFIGGGVIAAAALVVGFQNYPPQPKDAAGTIGAAQRYHEPQITGADVKVSQDELTTWIQSDTFDRIVKDPEARRLFANEAVQRVLADAANKQLSIADDARNQIKLADGANKQLSIADDARNQIKLADGANKQLSIADDARNQIKLADGANKQLAIADNSRNQNQVQLASDAKSQVKLLDELRKELSATDFAMVQAALNNDAIRTAMESQAFCTALANNAIRHELVNEARRNDGVVQAD